jgi:hypothetical protein
MKISEIREWADREFGEHSHQSTQIAAALGPIEEWLGHLARHGVMMEIVLVDETMRAKMAPPRHLRGEPQQFVNAGSVSRPEEVFTDTLAEAMPPFPSLVQHPDESDEDYKVRNDSNITQMQEDWRKAHPARPRLDPSTFVQPGMEASTSSLSPTDDTSSVPANLTPNANAEV